MTTKFMTIEEAIRNGNNGQNQEIKSKFIGQHVYCNVGPLVDWILNNCEGHSDAPFEHGHVENWFSFPEWSERVLGEDLYFEGGSQEAYDAFQEKFQEMRDEAVEMNDNEEISDVTYVRNLEAIDKAEYEFDQLEMEMQEVLEWWAVSDFLLGKLKANNEVVIDTTPNIWGRTCSGQAILLDSVITRICAEMGILEGQKYSWAK